MRRRESILLLCCALALGVPGAARARPPHDDGERQQRRAELRQQLQAERERWHGDGMRRGDAGRPYGASPGRPGEGAVPPPHGGHRMTPEERRALRQDLRRQQP
jgi:hypothetical protein